MRIGVLTVSDRCSLGLTEDTSGPAISELLASVAQTADYRIVPDDREKIESALRDFCDVLQVDFVFTTGGTGFSPRDVTPEATKAVLDREAPGIAEAIRAESMKITPRAMLSRATSGIRGKTLIVNLPGSKKAVCESIAVLLPVLEHAAQTLRGETTDCGRPEIQKNG